MSEYGIDRRGLAEFNDDTSCSVNKQALVSAGGVEGVAEKLLTHLKHGLSDGGSGGDGWSATRTAAFGSNSMPQPKDVTWFEFFLAAFEDTTVIILCVAALVSLAVGLYSDPKAGWIEGAAIIAAVLIVAVVTATNDYQKQLQFRALNAVKEDILVKVLRGGALSQVSTLALLVGDVVSLEAGDKVPADGLLIGGCDVQSNESSLTGEPEDVLKDAECDPFLLSGCQLTSGACTMLVTAVGADSRWGRIKARLQQTAKNTPLQDKLDDLAQLIGYVGLGAAVATFIALLVIWKLTPELQAKTALFDHVLEAFILGVTIVVVAVPEGLPLAVTISLAYSMSQVGGVCGWS